MLKMSKNTKIFLIVFSIFLLIVTIIAIVFKNNNKVNTGSQIIIEGSQKASEYDLSDSNEKKTNNNDKLTMDSTYSNNGLTFDIVEEDNPIKITSVQVAGLKDSNVQDSINKQIKERINKVLNSNYFKSNSDENAYVTTSVESNFSDVLSIKIYVQFKSDFSKCYGLNFRLDNGERIKFDDMFTSDAPIKNILTASAYKSYALGYYTAEGISNEFYANIEDDLINFLQDYYDENFSEYSFTPLTIDIYKDGKTVTIDMTKYYKYIAIYTDFVSNTNLYDSTDDVATELPVFIKRPQCIIDLYKKVSDTCVFDVIIYSDDKFSDKEKEVIEKYRKDLENRLSDLRKEKGMYYSDYIKVTKDADGKNLIFTEEPCKVQVEEKDFSEQVYSKILMAERDTNNLNYKKSKINILGSSVKKDSKEQKKYNVETGEEIKKEESEENNIQEDNQENSNTVNTTVEPSATPTQETPNTASPTPSVTPTPTPTSTLTPIPTPTPTGEVTTRVYF